MTDDSTIRYARGRDKFDASPVTREARDFDQFAQDVLRDRARMKGMQYITAPMRVNGDGRPHRGKDFVESRRFLALDVDHIAGPDVNVELRMWLARFKGFGFTTASSTPDAPRCRAILALDRDVDRVEGMRLGAAIQRDIAEEFGDRVKLDPSTHRGEQPCYGPVIQSEDFRFDGDPIDVDAWLQTAPLLEPERKGSAAIAAGDDPVIVRLKEAGMYRRDLGSGKHAIRCFAESEHSTLDDDASTATCYLQPHHNGYVTPGFRCLHEHCASRTGDDLLDFLGLDWRAVRDAYRPPIKVDEPAIQQGLAEEPPAYLDGVPPPQGASEAPRGEDAAPWPEPLDLVRLSGLDPQQPRFVIDGLLPAGYASLFAAHGGTGKSTIGLYQAVCVSLGLDFAGYECEPRRVLYLSCEDRERVLHWRLSRICRHLGISMAALAGKLEIVDLVGHDSILWIVDSRSGASYTAAYGELENRIKASNSQVIYVDGIADVYGGEESARAQVKQFVNALVGLIDADDGAVVLIGHVNKVTASGSATSEGYSGSTGWHNAVRARWYLYPEQEQDDDGRTSRTGRLLFELQKNNLGQSDGTTAWRWSEDAGMFLPEESRQSNFDRVTQQRDERRGILLAMKACAESDIYVPAATTGRRTAFHVLAAQSAFAETMRSGKASVRRFWREIEHLRSIRLIEDSSIQRANRHKADVLVLTSEGMRQCA